MNDVYFTNELFRFLKQLKRHNQREWFQANKPKYEAVVRDPCCRFIADLAGPLQRVSPLGGRSPSHARFDVPHLPRYALFQRQTAV
jgi:uncharacterized protein (DUF2461 family)